jgi:predicted transcriptional regulator
LTDAAVEVRYPGFSVDKKIAREMFKTSREVRNLVSLSLGLTLANK